MNLPVSNAYAWKSGQSDIENDLGLGQIRQTRLVDGQEVVRLGTKAQQSYIIRRFEEEIGGKMPQRKKLYQEAIDRAMEDDVELKASTTDVEENKPSSVKDEVIKVDPQNGEGSVEAIETSPSSQAIEENDDIVFAREIERAMQLSLDSAHT